MKNKNKIFSFFDVAVVVVITSVIMYFLGGLLIFRHLGGVNYSLLGNDEKLQEFISAYNGIVNNYYDSLDKDALIDGAINGMYSTIDDPYTTYLDSDNTNYLNDSLSGKYEGIGIRIEATDEAVKVIEVFEDSPAKKAGIQVGDIITEINGKPITSNNTTDAVNMIKKSENEEVKIVVNRNGSSLTFDVKIDDLLVPVVDVKLLNRNNQNVGYIKLSIFNDTADVQFENALSKLENSGISSLIIDLRGNTGGYLEVAKNIAEMFLEKNKIIYSLENKDSKETYKDKTSEKRNYKVVVLTNGSSASASEILAAALKYSYGATLIGEKTYGKGKVQERASLTDGTTVKYTTAKWLTPKGDCIDEVGLSPDYEVAFDEGNYNIDDIYSDSQVIYSLNYLVG